MFHHESWIPIYFGIKGLKVKFIRHKNSAGVGFCTLVSAGFFWFPLSWSIKRVWQPVKRHRTCVVAGTLIAGLSISCGSQVRLQHKNKINIAMLNTWAALLQFTTTPLFLIGWIWSVLWSIDFISISSESPKPAVKPLNTWSLDTHPRHAITIGYRCVESNSINTQGQTTRFLWKQTWFAVKGCYIWLDSLDLLQQLLGGQPFRQATVTLKFKIASKMAAIFQNLHINIITDCYYIIMCNTSFLWFSRSWNLFTMVSEWFEVIWNDHEWVINEI